MRRTAMLPSVRALLSRIIDYAGMFPPAQLPLEQAIRNYARYRTEPESWMLGRFVCPAAQRLKFWEVARHFFPASSQVRISALVSSDNAPSRLGAGFTTEVLASGVIVDSFELKSTPESLGNLAGEH